jgi:hypothetical protein
MMLFNEELRSGPVLHPTGTARYYTRAQYSIVGPSQHGIAPPRRIFDGATGVSTLLIQVMIQHVLDPRACRAPLRVAITHQQGTHCGIWITTPTSVLFSVRLQPRRARQALLRRLQRAMFDETSQSASQPGCHVPIQLPSCQSPLSSPPSAVMYDTIARRKLFSVHSEAGGPVHQHRES